MVEPRMKRLLLFLAAAGAIAGGVFYWKYPGSSSTAAGKGAAAARTAPKGVPVKVERVRAGTISEELNAVGTLLANESVMIRPERDGRITAIHFNEGQLVRRGERLVSLDSVEIEAQLAAADSELALNRSRLKRAEDLFDRKFISAQALDDARAAVAQSAARRAEIQARLEKSTILAPFEGVAGLRQASPGAYVKAGQDIARLEGIGTLKLDFRVPEVFLGRIRVGQEAQVAVAAYAGEAFRGTIYAIEPAVDEQTRTVLLRARVPNPGVRLKPGMFARVTLVLETRPDALLVPEQALVPQGRERFVFRIEGDKAVMTRVETGLRRPGEVEIRQGLAAGDTIVLDGQLRLRDGATVMVLTDKPPSKP
jgi:membrane fusion protein (multidrug efflux system)